MIKKIFFLSLLCGIFFTSCVSSKVHKDLQSQYDAAQVKNKKLSEDLRATKSKYEAELTDLRSNFMKLSAERDGLKKEFESC